MARWHRVEMSGLSQCCQPAHRRKPRKEVNVEKDDELAKQVADMLEHMMKLMCDQAMHMTGLMGIVMDLDRRMKELERKFSHVEIHQISKN
jgi:hypothetical protein